MLCIGGIVVQDFKDRAVYWVLFPLLGSLLFVINILKSSENEIVILSVLLNLLLVATILFLVFLYTKIVLKRKFIDYSLGLGDVLFFIAMALGFPTVTFLTLYVHALLFSFLFFLAIKKKLKEPTIPLAGLMGIYLIIVLGYSIFFDEPQLYLL